LTTALGPVLGGWLVDTLSWRAIFFVNAPIAVAAVCIALRSIPETRDDETDRAAVDWKGGVLVTMGLGFLTYGFTSASENGWSNTPVLIALALGTSVLCFFIRFEGAARAPMMPLSLFRSKAFSGANLITLILYFALSGAMYFLPFNLIRVQGYSATAAGAAFLPFILLMGGLSRWTGGWFDRYGARMPLIVGPAIVAAGFALLAVPGIGGSYWMTIFPAMLVLGIGMAITVPPLTTTVMRAVDDRHSGVASGINNATARIAGLLAVALLGAVVMAIFRGDLGERASQLNLSTEVRQALAQESQKLADAEVPKSVAPHAREQVQQALHESFVHSYRVAMILSAMLALLSAVCAWLVMGRKAR
jgi:MFS family permease